MTGSDHRSRDIEALGRRLESLEIVISRTGSGFTVASYSEPLFCFEASDIEEAKSLVSDTLCSYIEKFYHVQRVNVGAEVLPLDVQPIPVRHVQPVNRLKTTLRDLLPDAQRCGIAQACLG